MSKKLGVVITDGVGFRNFILGTFMGEAEKIFDSIVILSCLPKTVYENHTTVPLVELSVFVEPFKTWLFRKAKEVSHLRLHKEDNFGIADNLRANRASTWSPRGIATRVVYGWTYFFHSEKWILKYEKWQQASFKNHLVTKEYQEILEREQVDVLFFTHQRPAFIAPLAAVAIWNNIKTTSFIFSWDNLASKGRMAATFDSYLVWSDLMKKELLHFYPHTVSEKIKVVGTPQFEPYVMERYNEPKEAFYSKFNLNEAHKIICFSCGDISTSKNDELYITAICEAIVNKEIPMVNLLIRTSPAEDPIRFSEIQTKYPFIKWNFPDWKISRGAHQEAWSQRVPGLDDVADLRAILTYSDLNINMLSTMSLDFMQFDKPVINPVFGNLENGLYNDQRFLAYEHIKHVVNSEATMIVKNKTELVDAMNLLMEKPTLLVKGQHDLISLQIGAPLEGTGKRMAQTLLQWA